MGNDREHMARKRTRGNECSNNEESSFNQDPAH